MSVSAFRASVARLHRPLHFGAPAGERLPLAGLRTAPDEASAATKWLLHPDGVIGRALIQPTGSVVTVPLRLANGVMFSVRAMLLPHDWRDRGGAVCATVMVTDPDGRQHETWSGILRASPHGRRSGLRVRCQIPKWSTSVQLRTDCAGVPSPDAVDRAIWVEPAIIDPHAPVRARQPANAPAAREPLSPTSEPLISVLVPVHDPPLHMLEDAIASVKAQTFTNWELCLVDDGSTNPKISAALAHHASSDPRIHMTRRDTAGGISVATNTALALATGRYIALVDHDDTLTADALHHVAATIATQPDLDMIYTDEDVVADGCPPQRHPKPGWSPEHMSALMYTCHLGVYRRALAIDLGGFQSRFDGCQDYDFVLRLMERTDRIAHIPRILYHWHAHPGSTAGGDAKPYAYLAQPAAITEHLRRTAVDAEVQFGHLPGLHRIVHRVRRDANVDLVLAVENLAGVAEAAASWIDQPHPTWNVVLAAPADALDAARAVLRNAGIPDSRIIAVPTPASNLASALAAGADAARAEHLLLMQGPVIGLTHDWLTRLVGYSQQPQIAAAGPIVLAPNGRIQHAGIAMPDGVPLYLCHGEHPAGAQTVVHNVSAVSGVLAARRDTYRALGGLNPEFKDLALIEYCLRATDAGQRIVIVPDARLRAAGPDHTINDLPTIWRLRDSWAYTHTHDSYYNPNYRTDRGDFVLSG